MFATLLINEVRLYSLHHVFITEMGTRSCEPLRSYVPALLDFSFTFPCSRVPVQNFFAFPCAPAIDKLYTQIGNFNRLHNIIEPFAALF